MSVSRELLTETQAVTKYNVTSGYQEPFRFIQENFKKFCDYRHYFNYWSFQFASSTFFRLQHEKVFHKYFCYNQLLIIINSTFILNGLILEKISKRNTYYIFFCKFYNSYKQKNSFFQTLKLLSYIVQNIYIAKFSLREFWYIIGHLQLLSHCEPETVF